MNITVNMATYGARKDLLPKTIACLQGQTVKPDKIRVFHNDPDYSVIEGVEQHYNGINYTDRSKFIWLDEIRRTGDHEAYFSCDDDLYYPPNYIERTLEAMKQYPFPVCWHGRKLLGKGRDYYRGHKNYTFMSPLKEDVSVDVPGTGVTAFVTSGFCPDIIQYPEHRMADVLFGLEAAKEGKQIVCLTHNSNWIRGAHVSESIYQTEHKNATRQQELCDKILDLKKERKNSYITQ